MNGCEMEGGIGWEEGTEMGEGKIGFCQQCF